MASFLSLPLELRQNIIFLALKDAAFQDIRFSNFQPCFDWNLYRPYARRKNNSDYRTTMDMICTPNVY